MCKKLTIILMIVLVTIISGCQSKETLESKEIIISVAASLKEPMDKIKESYEKNNNIKININTGGSGILKKQISEGADVDIFFCANKEYMDELVKEELVFSDEVYLPLKNSLVLVKNNDAKDKINIFSDLGLGKMKIALGDITTVPAGEYAKESLINMNIWESVKEKIIYGKDVKAVKTYVENGDVDFGFIYKSDAKDLKNAQIVLEVPKEYHKEIIYSIAPIKSGENYNESIKIIKYIMSNEGKEIFKEYGFNVGDK